MASTISIKKQPSETIIVGLDFSDILGSNTISAINSTAVTIVGSDDASDLTIDSSSLNSASTIVNFELSGGTSGLSYQITAVVATDGGETLEGDGLIIVKELMAFIAPVMILRTLISDVSDDPTYSDSRLLDIFMVAAYQVNAELGLSYTVDLDSNTITPSMLADDDFINLATLKAACIIDRGSMRLASAIDGVEAVCGPAKLKVSARMQGFATLIDKGYCAAYKEAVKQYKFGNAGFAKGILSPFVNSSFFPQWNYADQRMRYTIPA